MASWVKNSGTPGAAAPTRNIDNRRIDMADNSQRTALVTGATSGLGFEAAAQLAEAGYAKVTITGRTPDKATAALRTLAERTGRSVFDTIALDLGSPQSVANASIALADRGEKIDFLLLNAGAVSGSKLIHTDQGIETTFVSSLVGHHQLTMQLLDKDMLAADARIVIAGSEAARGDVPTFNVVDLPDFAGKHFDGDLEEAALAIFRQDSPVKYKAANAYANAKLFVAWWAASLAHRLPGGMTVNAVSPGSAPDTNAARNAGFFMRTVLLPMFKHAPARLGMAAPVSVAAARYLEAADFGEDVTGQFFASAPKKMTGPLHRMEHPHFHDRTSQEAAWNATVKVAGGVDMPIAG